MIGCILLGNSWDFLSLFFFFLLITCDEENSFGFMGYFFLE